MTDVNNTSNIKVKIYSEIDGTDFDFSTDTQGSTSVAGDKTITLTLKSLTYQKQIGSPSYARAEVYCNSSSGVTLKEIANFLKEKKVDLTHAGTDKPIASNFFIFGAMPSVDANGMMTIALDIYSLDKLLDTVKYSRSYTARKLRAEILPDAISRCKYNGLAVPCAELTDEKLTFLSYGSDNNEFPQPYVVQYNETPYAMLSRTANRCGEFFFFEGGVLHMGLSSNLTPVKNDTNDTKDTKLIVKNDEKGLRFLSVSYQDTVGSVFGSNQNFFVDNYQAKLGNDNGEALEYLKIQYSNVSAAMQWLLAKMNSTYSNYTEFSNDIDPFCQNADYYACYHRAKSAHSAYLHYAAEIQRLDSKMQSYQYKDGKFSDARLEQEFVPYMEDAIKSKDGDLQAALADQNKNDYYHKKQGLDVLAQKAKKAKEEWLKAKEEQSDDEDAKADAYRDAQAAYLNEKDKYKPSIEELIDEERKKISKLRTELDELRQDLAAWKDKQVTEDTKKKLLEKYRDAISDRLQKQYDALNAKKTEMQNAQSEQLKEPDVYTKYKDKSSPWDRFKEWAEVVKAEATDYKDRLDDIWKNTLKEGKELFPVSVKDCVKKLKDCVSAIKTDINDTNKIATVLTDVADKNQALKYCDDIIKYCEAYGKANGSSVDTSMGNLGVYDFEYGNDEFLQKAKKDAACSYNDFYFTGLTRNQTTSSYAGAGILGVAARFLTDRKTKIQFLAEEAVKQIVINATVGTNYEVFKSDFNKSFIGAYQINGSTNDKFKSSDGNEMSLFTNYDHKTTKSDIGVDAAKELFSGMFYKSVYALQRSIDQQRILIKVDCSANKKEPQLGTLIEYADLEYIVTGVCGSIMTDEVESGGVPRLEQVVEAVPRAKGNLFLPTMCDLEHLRKSEPQMAVVTNDNDPSFEGRVRVRFHWQAGDSEPSPWIRVGTPYATKGGGMLFIPHVGDHVMLDFEHGNVERPFVVNSLYSEGNGVTPPTTIASAPRRQTISSANGHSITFTDLNNATFLTEAFSSFPLMTKLGVTGDASKLGTDTQIAGGVEISDSFGFYKIACSADRRNITVESPFGDVNISAFTGISIKAPNGDVKIEAKNIELNAGNEIRITSGTYLKDEMDNNSTWDNIGIMFGNELLDQTLGTIDFSLIRHLLERFIRPISASLQIKSYRFILLDSGKDDFCSQGIIDTNSNTKKVKAYKGWKDSHPDESGYSTSAAADSIADTFGNIFRSIMPEKNLWKVQSQKSAIIVAGDMYSTTSNKSKITDFTPNGKRADASKADAGITDNSTEKTNNADKNKPEKPKKRLTGLERSELYKNKNSRGKDKILIMKEGDDNEDDISYLGSKLNNKSEGENDSSNNIMIEDDKISDNINLNIVMDENKK